MPLTTLSRTENGILANCLLYIMVSITQTRAHIKSQEFIGYIKQHFVTTRHGKARCSSVAIAFAHGAMGR